MLPLSLWTTWGCGSFWNHYSNSQFSVSEQTVFSCANDLFHFREGGPVDPCLEPQVFPCGFPKWLKKTISFLLKPVVSPLILGQEHINLEIGLKINFTPQFVFFWQFPRVSANFDALCGVGWESILEIVHLCLNLSFFVTFPCARNYIQTFCFIFRSVPELWKQHAAVEVLSADDAWSRMKVWRWNWDFLCFL